MSEKLLKGNFEINVGCVDSFIRIFIGLIFMSAALVGTIGMWGLAGGILVINGLSRYSLLYVLFGINTTRCDREPSH